MLKTILPSLPGAVKYACYPTQNMDVISTACQTNPLTNLSGQTVTKNKHLLISMTVHIVETD